MVAMVGRGRGMNKIGKEGKKISENVWYLDLGEVYTFQNASSCILDLCISLYVTQFLKILKTFRS